MPGVIQKNQTTPHMKKLLFALIATLGICAADAQVPTRSTKTITTADTLTQSNVGDRVVGLQATYVETSGTSAGKFYIEGSVDGLAWVHIDSSKSLSDVTTAQSVVVAVTATTYRDYRVRCSNTSSATGTLYFTVLRRTDDHRIPEPLPMAFTLPENTRTRSQAIYAVSKFIPYRLQKPGARLRPLFYPQV